VGEKCITVTNIDSRWGKDLYCSRSPSSESNSSLNTTLSYGRSDHRTVDFVRKIVNKWNANKYACHKARVDPLSEALYHKRSGMSDPSLPNSDSLRDYFLCRSHVKDNRSSRASQKVLHHVACNISMAR